MHSKLPKVLATLAALAAVSVLAVGGTYANFTATPVTISSNAFTTGSLTMARSGSGVISTSPRRRSARRRPAR